MNKTETPKSPVQLNDADDLNEFIEKYDRAMVEFYTEGCGICASVEPIIGLIAQTTSVAVGTVNPRNDPSLIENYTIKSVPKFILFEKGKIIDERADGYIEADKLRKWIDESFTSTNEDTI